MFGKHASDDATGTIMTGRLIRVIAPAAPALRFLIDGEQATAYAGESVLVAVLAARNAVRRHEFSDEMRAGFCLMGACQDCWVWLADHSRVRACATAGADGMHVLSGAPPGFPTS